MPRIHKCQGSIHPKCDWPVRRQDNHYPDQSPWLLDSGGRDLFHMSSEYVLWLRLCDAPRRAGTENVGRGRSVWLQREGAERAGRDEERDSGESETAALGEQEKVNSLQRG